MCEPVRAWELNLGKNILTYHRVFKLPSLNSDGTFLEDGQEVNLMLMEEGNYSVESPGLPIKFGKYFPNFFESWLAHKIWEVLWQSSAFEYDD